MYCTNCGKKIPDDSKFCVECGKSTLEESVSPSVTEQAKGKPRRRRWLKITIWVVCLMVFLPAISFVLIGYFVPPAPYTYTHPALGFTFDYPKTLNASTTPINDPKKCPTEPCVILLQDLSYTDYASNWIFVVPIPQAAKKEAIADLDKDVKDGWATTTMINDIKMYSYTNEPAGKNKSFISACQAFGLDPAKQQSAYVYIADNSIIAIGFRKPPEGAPVGYKDYLNIKSWKMPAKTQ